ncbi:hypothetical protein DCG74_31140 [Bradyrhizobium sp. WBAH42]|uniref:hypothetical protein n=1 Tax=Bradyrhizobium sp. WBAH42 TaxID=1390132 RepID=UPI00155E6794|nr:MULTISPECIES: hypothetical protein [Bradyrhizobium]MDD1518444.1 hypothetical protein [Bradyrhizobium sp. WBAH30]MDD1542242.1 hypothetical protein [Bradyrhizobium sp. WBAH41]MDD1556394.1 hypothetical protein [Bradyrhizobium sp. WBAH23]MDD1561765.1 hypothetical protein [Bradyrhizobium sp. WBAH33]MDD1589213.1 hypothetical protein [Bradyrhizobium sp. WBAH42]
MEQQDNRTCSNEEFPDSPLAVPSCTPSRMVARAPELGEQTDEVLKEFGFGADEIARLRDAKVV